MVNGKYYIGQHRTENLKDGYLGSGNVLKQAINKYGRKNFKREILEFCDSAEQLNETEIRWVTQELVEDENCYNMKTGGDQCCEWGTKSRKKLSISKTGTKATNETKEKLRTIAINNNPFKGKKHTEETKQILREKCANFGEKNGFYGKKHSEETKNKISQSKLGKERTVESRLKQSSSVSGKNNHFYGRKHSEESIQKIREANVKYGSDIVNMVAEMRRAGKKWKEICNELNIEKLDSIRKAVHRSVLK